MNKLAPWLLILLTALPLTAQPPPSPSSPQTPSSSSSPQSREPLTLRTATSLAAEHSPDLGAARATAEVNAWTAKLAEDAFRPEAYASTTPGVARGLPVAVLGAVPAIAGVELRQVFYDPQHRAEAISARADAFNSTSSFERSRLDAARAAAEAYARCWADQSSATTAANRIVSREGARARIATLLGSGRTTELELNKADLAIARAKLRQLDANTEREVDLMTLRRLTGLSSGSEIQLGEEPLAALPAPGQGDAVAAAEANDLEIRSATQSIHLLDQAQRMVGGLPLPVVAAEAQYYRLTRANGIDQFYKTFKENDWSIALSVTYPLWTAGRQHDMLARARASLDRSTSQRDARKSMVAVEVERATITASSAEAGATIAHQAHELARQALDQAQILSDAARIDPSELEQRQAELADAEDEATQADLRLFRARLDLLVLRGDLSSTLLLPTPGEATR
jgi:outer membrane protein TolC